jgi:zinc transport system substrate-binding protein
MSRRRGRREVDRPTARPVGSEQPSTSTSASTITMPNTERRSPNAWFARGGVLLVLLLAGWTAGSAMRGRHSQEWPPRDKRIRILTTIFPIYDFARQIGGEDAVVRNLLPPGVDPHEFALSPRDISLVAGADVILANGAGLDDFVGEAIQKAGISAARIVSLTGGLPMLNSHTERGTETGDPHMWLDPVHAEAYVGRISVALAGEANARRSSVAADRIRERTVALGRAIMELDREYTTRTADLKGRSFIAFHGAFGYLSARYGLGLAGVWQKTPGREPSPHEVEALLKIATSSGVRALFAEPQFSPRAIEMIAADAHLPVYTLDPLETAEDFDRTHYVDVMRKNLEVLVRSLSRGK